MAVLGQLHVGPVADVVVIGKETGKVRTVVEVELCRKVEELVHALRGTVTVIIVTHNMQQAARVSDRTAFMLLGELVESGPTSEMFTTPRDSRTEDYITGRFG